MYPNSFIQSLSCSAANIHQFSSIKQIGRTYGGRMRLFCLFVFSPLTLQTRKREIEKSRNREIGKSRYREIEIKGNREIEKAKTRKHENKNAKTRNEFLDFVFSLSRFPNFPISQFLDFAFSISRFLFGKVRGENAKT